MATYSEKLTFKVDCNCNRFTPYRFAWLNRLGGIDTYTFRLASTRTVTAERSEYTKYLSYLQTDNTWGYLKGDRGRTVYDVQSIDIFSVVSTYHNEDTHKWLAELFTSPAVYLINPSLTFGFQTYDPIIVTKNSVSIRNKQGFGNRLLSHDIEFVKAYKNVIQRG